MYFDRAKLTKNFDNKSLMIKSKRRKLINIKM